MGVIGIDIGASNFKAGRVENDIIEEKSFKAINRNASPNKILEDLFGCIDCVITNKSKRIGVGVPGIVDPLTGVVYDVQNIPVWQKIFLKDLIQERYNLPVFINNDANCFAIGEKMYGKGRGVNNFIGLSLGTGIGMGVIINNEIYNGVLCGAGEIGMVSYKESIIEHYASSFFFTEKYGFTAKELYDLARAGDEFALKAFDQFGYHLGEVLKNILYLFAPEVVILGGSISKAYPFFKKSVAASLGSFAYQRQIKNFKIEISNEIDSAILGAAALCLQE